MALIDVAMSQMLALVLVLITVSTATATTTTIQKPPPPPPPPSPPPPLLGPNQVMSAFDYVCVVKGPRAVIDPQQN